MYLDDMLVIAQSREELERQQIISLLELLGFYGQLREVPVDTVLPTQLIQYLGFLVGQSDRKKPVTHMMTTCVRVQQKHSLPVWKLARLIGKMTATLPAICQAPLWY